MTTQPNLRRGGRPPAPAPSFDEIATSGVSRSHLARLLGVTATAVDSWRRRGCPSHAGRFLLREVFAWHGEQLPARAAPAKEEDSEQSLARWRRARATREELQLEQDRAELVSREQVVALYVGTVDALRARLKDATKKLAQRTFEAPSIVANERELRAEFDSMLRAFAAGLARLPEPDPGDDAPPAELEPPPPEPSP